MPPRRASADGAGDWTHVGFSRVGTTSIRRNRTSAMVHAVGCAKQAGTALFRGLLPMGGARGIPLYAMEYPRFYKQTQIHIHVYACIFATFANLADWTKAPKPNRQKAASNPPNKKGSHRFPGRRSQFPNLHISSMCTFLRCVETKGLKI